MGRLAGTFWAITLVVFLSAGLMSCGSGGGGGATNTTNTADTGDTGGGGVIASGAVGASGGTVQVSDPSSILNGASVNVPAGALSVETQITISEESTCPDFLLTNNNICTDFGPDGTTFNSPATITIPYDDTIVTDENNLRVYTYNSIEGYWEEVQTVSINTINNVITAKVSHFTRASVQEKQSIFYSELLQMDNGKLVAKVVLTKPFTELPFSSLQQGCAGDSDVAASMLNNPSKISFKYHVTLVGKDSLFDNMIETKTITYEQLNTNGSGTYSVKVFDGDTEWFTSSGTGNDPLNHDDWHTWYSGAPALFMFDFIPIAGKEYYVKTKLEVLVDNCLDTTIFHESGRDASTIEFASASHADSDGHGIVDTYETAARIILYDGPPDTIRPGMPANLSVAIGTTSNDLRWARSFDDIGVTGYNIYRSEFGNHRLDFTQNLTYSDDHLIAPSTEYCYRVSSYDAAGNESEWTPEVCVTRPAPPDTVAPTRTSGLVASVSHDRIDLSWNASTDNVGVAGYNVHRTDSFIWWSVFDTSFSDTGLDPGTSYCYHLTVFDAAGNESGIVQICASTLTVPDDTAPSAPSGLVASVLSDSQIRLSWDASTDDTGVTQYNIYKYGSPFKQISGGLTFISDTGLSESSRHCYTVTAMDAAKNESEPSTEVCKYTASATNTTPVAWIPYRTPSMLIGDSIKLDGSYSFDDDGDPLTYSWEIARKPEGSLATISDADSSSVYPSITPDLKGIYNIHLTVNDGMVDSRAIVVYLTASDGLRFVDNGDDTVTDKSTGLMWVQLELDPRDWGSAKNDCNSATLMGHRNWRLPYISELDGLRDPIFYRTQIDSYFFPGVSGSSTSASVYWSVDTSVDNALKAYAVRFYYSPYNPYIMLLNKTERLRIRCVRTHSDPK